jgi:hypothetical protein
VSEQAVERTEYRVVRSDDGLAGRAFTAPLPEMEDHRESLEAEHWRPHHIQTRTVTETPWVDVEGSAS